MGGVSPAPSECRLTTSLRRSRLQCCEPDGGRLELPRLLAAEVTLIFAYSFARTLVAIVSSPDFAAAGGWLAPVVPAEPVRFGQTLLFAGTASSLWVVAGLWLGAFTLAENATPDQAVRVAARVSLVCGCAYVAIAAAGSVALGGALCDGLPLCARQGDPALSPDDCASLLGLSVGLGLWRRTYADSIWW